MGGIDERGWADVRLGEVVGDLERFVALLDGWATGAVDLGHLGQFASPVRAISEQLSTIGREAIAVSADAEGGPIAEVYVAARLSEARAAYLWGIWRWFADKLDQRRPESASRAFLLAADEVVWSTWSTAWTVAGRTPVPPAPIPYEDNRATPMTMPRNHLPAQVRPAGDGFLQERTRVLPVATIAVPPNMARRPWCLVTVVHETAHQLHRDLVSAEEDEPATTIRQAVCPGHGLDVAKRWGRYARELFADTVTAALTGRASVWCIAEALRGPRSALIAANDEDYPSPAARIEFLRSVLRHLELEPGPHPFGTTWDDETERDLAVARTAAEAMATLPIGGGRMDDLVGDGDDAIRNQWRDDVRKRLRHGVSLVPGLRSSAPRDVLAGTVLAREAMDGSAGNILTAGDVLAPELLEVIASSRQDGKRAGAEAWDGGIETGAWDDLRDELFGEAFVEAWS